MKKLIYIIFLLCLCPFFVEGQEVISRTMSSPTLNGKNISLRIYLPEGYDPNATPYRWMIYLHGCCGNSNNSMISNLQTVLDNRINNSSIEPMIVVLPNLQGSDFSNLHFWWDSKRNGDIGSMLTTDLLNYMKINYNVSDKKERRAIGGFSMGADGAMWHGLHNSDLFCASISHSAVPDFNKYVELAVPKVISETGQTTAPFNYKPTNGFYSNDLFGICGTWSPNLDSTFQVDFLLNNSGDIKDSVLNQILRIADGKTVINNFWSQEKRVPIAIYFDWGSNDLEFYKNTNPEIINDLNQLVDSEGWEINFKHILFTDNQSSGHVFSIPRIDSAMVWLNNIMSSNSSSLGKKNKIAEFRIFPNPSTGILNIEDTGIEFLKHDFFHITGNKVKSVKGLSQNSIEIDEFSPGIYILKSTDTYGQVYLSKFFKR